MAESESGEAEERLRQQALARQERRRRRLQSPEERLALITGRPVEETRESVTSSTAEDPPLETLTREVRPPGLAPTSSVEGNVLASLLGGETSSEAAGLQSPASCELSDWVWVMLGLVVRITLETEYSVVIGHNVFIPFALTVSLCCSLGFLKVAPSTSSTILSAGQ